MFGRKSRDMFTAESIAMSSEPLKITPLKFDTEIELRTRDLEIKAKGFSAEGIIEIIHASAGIPKEHFGDLFENFEKNKKPKEEPKKEEAKPKKEVKRRVHEVSEDDMVESIDLSEMKDKMRLPRTSSDFRCPHCAQAFITRVSKQGRSQWVFRDAASETPIGKGINLEDIVIDSECTEQELKDKLIDIYKGLDELTFEKNLLVYQDGQEGYCPVCNQSAPLVDWMDAYSSPLDFFEVSNLCDICGDKGGLAMTETSSFCECDNNCLSKSKKEEVASLNISNE